MHILPRSSKNEAAVLATRSCSPGNGWRESERGSRQCRKGEVEAKSNASGETKHACME